MYPQFQYNAQQIVRVNGEGGARAYQMMPNSSALLLDETAPLVWLKTTDGAGFPTVTAFEIKEHKPEPAPDYNALIARIDKLEEKLNEPHTSSNESCKQYDKAIKYDHSNAQRPES